MFFSSWKTVFKQSRQLLGTSSTPSYLSSFSTSFYCNLDNFLTARWIDWQTFWTLDSVSTASGLIELLYYLFCWIVPRQILDSCIYQSLLCSTPLNTSICRDLLNSYINIQSDSVLTFLDLSLSTDPSLHLPNTLFSLQTFNPRDFRPLLASNHLVCSLISSFFMQFMHLDQSFGVFEKNLGFFKIFEFLLKFWDGFLFTLSLNLMHCIT